MTSDRFTEKHVSADGFKVRYLDGGAGATVVMIHGGGGLDGELNDAYRLLADRYRVVALEMPGWGAEPNPRTSSLREMAATLAAAVKAAGIDRYRLIGTSLGAVVAAWIAAEHPEAVTALVLESPAVFRGGGAPGPRERGGPPDPAAFNYKPEKRWQRAPTPEQLELMVRIVGPDDTEKDLAARMPDCQVPTLVVFGRHDGIFPVRLSEHYRTLPNGHLTVFEEAAHDVKGDRPEAFAGVVDRFFRDGADAVPETIGPDDAPWQE